MQQRAPTATEQQRRRDISRLAHFGRQLNRTFGWSLCALRAATADGRATTLALQHEVPSNGLVRAMDEPAFQDDARGDRVDSSLVALAATAPASLVGAPQPSPAAVPPPRNWSAARRRDRPEGCSTRAAARRMLLRASRRRPAVPSMFKGNPTTTWDTSNSTRRAQIDSRSRTTDRRSTRQPDAPRDPHYRRQRSNTALAEVKSGYRHSSAILMRNSSQVLKNASFSC